MRTDGFFCAFWVQKRAKELMYFAEYKKHSISWKILPKNHMYLTATDVFSRNVPSASLPMVCLIILSVAQTICQMLG